MNEPHGGWLVDRLVAGEPAAELKAEASRLPALRLGPFELADLEMLATGGFSPLDGFMGHDDYQSVLRQMRLVNGLAWTLPVTLAVAREVAQSLRGQKRVALASAEGDPLALLSIREVFQYDRELEARQVFGTSDQAHPGVAYIMSRGDWYVGGPIEVFRRPSKAVFAEYRLDPAETRRIFSDRGWKSVVGFQTRNPVHRADEYVQKAALEMADGLLLHTLACETQSTDLSLDTHMRCYEVLLENYFPHDRVLLALNPALMRHAGPREVILHALVEKNFGCTHFIVGRDPAGVSSYYDPYDSQAIFAEFDPIELGITPLFFEDTFYCRKCAGMATRKTCGHDSEARVVLSENEVRAILRDGERLPPEFTRPEVAEVLREAYAPSHGQIARQGARNR